MHPVLIILYCEGFVKHVVAPYSIVDLTLVYLSPAMSDAATQISCSLFQFLTSKNPHACIRMGYTSTAAHLLRVLGHAQSEV